MKNPSPVKLIPAQAGVILLPLIILILFASISIYGVTTFIVARAGAVSAQKIRTGAVYLAQAGVAQALYDYRLHAASGPGYFTLGETSVDADRFFVIGGTDADLLMVDVSQTVLGGELTPDECRIQGSACDAECAALEDQCNIACDDAETMCYEDADARHDACIAGCPGGNPGKACRKACDRAYTADRQACHALAVSCSQDCHAAWVDCKQNCQSEEQDCLRGNRLTKIFLQNATDSRTLTLDRMVFTWDNSYDLKRIVIAGQVLWTGTAATPADADLSPDLTLDASQTEYEIDYVLFSDTMADATYVTIEFVMADGSSKTVPVYPASNNNNFTVRSTGKTTGSPVYRTVVAEYNALTGTVVDEKESDDEITP